MRPEIQALSIPEEPAFPEVWYGLADEAHFWMQWRLAAFLRLLADLDVPRDAPWRGCDVGCGAGTVRHQLEQRTSWTIDGVERSALALERGLPSRGDNLLYDVHDRRAELAGRYDVVLLFDVLEHVADAGAFLDATLFHLRPGGWLFVNVPAFESLWSPYDEAQGHLRRYDRSSLGAALSRRELEVKEVRYWGLTLVPLLAARAAWLSGTPATADVMRRGFQPPHPLVHLGLKALMRLETRLGARRPPAGTSVIAGAVKASGTSA